MSDPHTDAVEVTQADRLATDLTDLADDLDARRNHWGANRVREAIAALRAQPSRDDVIEACARVAESFPATIITTQIIPARPATDDEFGEPEEHRQIGTFTKPSEIATAIRALKEGQ